MTILFLEPFFAGSHASFARGIQKDSSHHIELLTLPGRFWKWRMRGASLEFRRQIEDPARFDLVIATNLMDLAQWKALTPEIKAPHILYVHENQLAYPLREGQERDFQYGWTDYANMLCADRVVFNSAYNRDSFFAALDQLITRLPDCRPERDFSALRKKSRIIPPGCRLSASWNRKSKCEETGEAPLILWNHRWEHDKNPEDFFAALEELRNQGVLFRLALLGESYSASPECFHQARTRFSRELIHTGYLENREAYESWLDRADFVISTARQENFGISVVEAVSFGAIPLLPERLAYPEVLPGGFHEDLLYGSLEDLREKLIRILARRDISALRGALSLAMAPYSWQDIIKRFDRLFEETREEYGR